MPRRLPFRRQSGAVIITTALFLLFLLGFMGFALDFGKLFVVKGELQTAMDSCALAGAQELANPPFDATLFNRARTTARTAGNLNKVVFQSATWSGKPQIVDADINFYGPDFSAAPTATNATYVECRHTLPQLQMWLLQAMRAFSGNTAAFPNAINVSARAVATRASSQTTCPLPLGLRPKGGGTAANNYGFVQGEWVTLLSKQNSAAGGQIGWMNLDGSKNAAETEAEMNGRCGTRIGDTLGTPGVQATIADTWNSRFGLYKNNSGPDQPNRQPDFTGKIYTNTSWGPAQSAYNDFVASRAAYAACGASVKACENATGLKLGGGFSSVASAGANGQLHQYGTNRRIVTVPVVSPSPANKVVDYVCMLLLQPMPIPLDDVKLEFLGKADAAGSPCTTNGLPGGAAGPKVPVLVR